jgi:peptide/nickel transport system substrate-binding protein
MRKLFVLLGLLVIAGMALAACGPAGGTEGPGAAPAPGEPAEPSAGPASKDPTTVTNAVLAEPETLDPAVNYETAGAEIIQNVYNTLVFFDGNKTDAYVPALAESWETSDDGTVWTFHIRPNVKFHEGGDLTPSDIAYSFQRGVLSGGTHSPQWLLAEPFLGVGVDDVSVLVDPEGNLYDDRAGIQAADPATLVAACEQVKAAIVADNAAGTVTFTLAQPWGPFLATIANGWGAAQDEEWVIDNGGWDGSCDTWQNLYATLAEESPFTALTNGTGPFKLDHWTRGEELVLVRNDSYWGEPAKLERVVFLVITEWGTRFAMLQAGDADIIDVPVENRPQPDEYVGERCEFDRAVNDYTACEVVDASKPLRLYIGQPGIIQDVILYNFNVDPESPYIGSATLDGAGTPVDFFADAHVRKAFSFCFDWDTFITDVYKGEAVQSRTLALPGMPGYDAAAPHYAFDADQCAAEFKLADLDHDGIAAGDDPEGDIWTTGFRLQMGYNQGNTTRQIVAEILAANVFAVNELFLVETLGLPWPSYLASQRAARLPVMTGGWLEDIHDPHNWYQPYTTGAYGARQRMPAEMKAEFKLLLDAGVAETDPAGRHAIYQDFNQMYYDLVPGAPIVVGTSHNFTQRWVQGRLTNPLFPGEYYYTWSKN